MHHHLNVQSEPSRLHRPINKTPQIAGSYHVDQNRRQIDGSGGRQPLLPDILIPRLILGNRSTANNERRWYCIVKLCSIPLSMHYESNT